MPPPKKSDLKRFCEKDGWSPKKRTDHWRYTKLLPDGRTLRTRVSFGSGEIGDPGLFAEILRIQLEVSEDEFWRVVRDGGPARRSTAPPPTPPASPALAASTVLQLRKLGVTDDQVRRLKSQAEAEKLLARRRATNPG